MWCSKPAPGRNVRTATEWATSKQSAVKRGCQEGQYPGRRESCTSNTVDSITDTPIVWTCGSSGRSDTWFADSAATIHVSPNREDFSSYQKYEQEHTIKVFGKNSVKGAGKGDILLRYPRLYIYPISTSILTLVSSYFYLNIHSQSTVIQ